MAKCETEIIITDIPENMTPVVESITYDVIKKFSRYFNESSVRFCYPNYCELYEQCPRTFRYLENMGETILKVFIDDYEEKLNACGLSKDQAIIEVLDLIFSNSNRGGNHT